jgi:hypothetical protein
MSEHADDRNGSPPPLPAAPWEQQPGEPDEAYNRFLVYLSMGPARSMRKAVALYKGQQPDTSGYAARGVPGTWATDGSRWKWRRRALLWDRHQIALPGQEAVAAYIAAVRELAMRLLESLDQPAEAMSLEQKVKVLDALRSHIAPESVRALLEGRRTEVPDPILGGPEVPPPLPERPDVLYGGNAPDGSGADAGEDRSGTPGAPTADLAVAGPRPNDGIDPGQRRE